MTHACPHCGHVSDPAPALTRKQFHLMLILQEMIDEFGVAPSFDDLRNEMGLKSKSCVAPYLRELEDKKYIKRKRYGPRSITILRRIEKPKAWGELELIVDNTEQAAQ